MGAGGNKDCAKEMVELIVEGWNKKGTKKGEKKKKGEKEASVHEFGSEALAEHTEGG